MSETELSIERGPICVNLDTQETGGLVPMGVEQVRIIYDSPFPDYEGPINVTPTAGTAQTLQTANRLVKSNITVEEIPYYETTNLSGGYTAIIGG